MMKLACVLLLTSAQGMAHASDGALEINEDCVAVGCFAGDSAGFPVTITQAGHYRLASDLKVTGTQDGVNIDVPEGDAVDLDLGGFSIDGLADCTGTPVADCGEFVDGGVAGIQSVSPALVRVHDGTIHGMQGPGLSMNGYLSGSSVENLTVSECNASGAYIGVLIANSPEHSITLRDVRVSRNRFGGIVVGTAATIVGAIVSGNAGYGLKATEPNVTVRESTFTGNSGLGITSLFALALGTTSFFNNNGGGNNAQYAITTLRDMSGNVCGDGTCP